MAGVSPGISIPAVAATRATSETAAAAVLWCNSGECTSGWGFGRASDVRGSSVGDVGGTGPPATSRAACAEKRDTEGGVRICEVMLSE